MPVLEVTEVYFVDDKDLVYALAEAESITGQASARLIARRVSLTDEDGEHSVEFEAEAE